MKERNGVRVGQRVRDLDGKDLGRVKELYASAFAVVKGFPVLFRQDLVARYDEVRGEKEGVLVLARSPRDLQELAAGGIPPAWRIDARPELPSAATPGEARPVVPAENEVEAGDDEEPEPPRPRAPATDAAHP